MRLLIFFTRVTPFIVFKKMELKDKKYKRILGIGDVHGCARHLEKLLAAVQPTGDDLIITLGDYIDRGPGSKGVLDALVRLHHDPGINIVSLRGNHDALVLMCLEGLAKASEYWPKGGAAWLRTLLRIYGGTTRPRPPSSPMLKGRKGLKAGYKI